MSLNFPITNTTLCMVLVLRVTILGSTGSKNLILGTRVPVLVFEITISGDYKHDIVYGVGTPCHNIGFHRIKKPDIGN